MQSWHKKSQSLITLSVQNAEELFAFYHKSRHLNPTLFREPDLADEITAVAYMPHEENLSLLGNLPLAGKDSSTSKEHYTRLKRKALDFVDTPNMRKGQLLRECYFTVLDSMSQNSEEKELLSTIPNLWTVDRALTLLYANEALKGIYCANSEIADLLSSPQMLPGWENALELFNQINLTNQEKIS